MKILIISPHPDDETLGAGGSILRYKAEGHQVFLMNITEISEELGYMEEQIREKENQLKKILDFYQFNGFYNMKLKTTRLDEYSSNEIIMKISKYMNQIEPNVVILPDYNDAHSDHKRVFDWGFACTKSFRYPSIKCILTMEILSETEFGRTDSMFVPNLYIDISAYLEQKVNAIKIYENEIGKHPFPRSMDNIRALATLRGASAGTTYAEAFKIVKMIY